MSLSLPSVVSVELDAAELGGPVRIGTLRRVAAPTGALVAFAYDEAWVVRKDSFVIDPTHGLYPGEQYPRQGSDITPIFADAAPDRWGRMLLERREALAARSDGRTRRALGDWEFLLGVADVSRMGALRFRDDDGRYLDDATRAIPPMADLRALEEAAREIELPSRGGRSLEAQHLALLLAPGSSLGGARPKATFLGQDGALWIAKFPSRNDTRDMAACEWVLNELAARAGICVPEHRLLALGSRHHTFAARRFDRAQGSRRLYASAMTMLSRRDREASSYLEIALAVADHGARGQIDAELAQLFRRAAFNVLAMHRDDHLRNHGFLRTAAGWQLAPAFDLNPMPEKAEHELAIDEGVHAGDIDLVIETAPFYRLTEDEAHAIVDEVRGALASWRTVTASAPLGEAEIEALADAIDAQGA
jgi:serine/threonine-protein kinase HipA